MSDHFIIQNARASFPTLVKPEVNRKHPTSPAKYGVDLIIDQNDPIIAALMARFHELALNQWKQAAPMMVQQIQANKDARSFGKGSERINGTTFERLSGYGDTDFYITAQAYADEKPQVGDSKGNIIPIIDLLGYEQEARRVYGGCYINAYIRPWLRLARPGISFRLMGFQFAKDGEPFGVGAADLSSVFGAVAAAPAGVAAPAGLAFPSFLA